jgi:hypothetical protein
LHVAGCRMPLQTRSRSGWRQHLLHCQWDNHCGYHYNMTPTVSWRRRHCKQEQCGVRVAPGMPAPAKDAELAFDIVAQCTFIDNIRNHHLLQSAASNGLCRQHSIAAVAVYVIYFKIKQFHCFFQLAVYYIIHFLYICCILNDIAESRISDKQKMLN